MRSAGRVRAPTLLITTLDRHRPDRHTAIGSRSLEMQRTIGEPEEPQHVLAVLREGSPDAGGEPLQRYDGRPAAGQRPGADHPPVNACDGPEDSVGGEHTV